MDVTVAGTATTTAPTTHAAAVLARAGDAVGPALRAALARLRPELAVPAAYHFGWAEADGSPRDGGGGRLLRPALALVCAEAAGARADAAMPGAVAVELIHAASLLQDDVMDEDLVRRHRPAAWCVFGVSRAVLVGDALLVLAQQQLLATTGATGPAACRRLLDATARTIAGQVDDLAFEGTQQGSLARYVDMADAKTGALLACAAALGAELGGAPHGTLVALARFGRHLGLAFQAVDDLLGIWGDPSRTGKPVHSDLRRRKLTLPVVLALSAPTEAAEALAELLRGGQLDEVGIERAVRLVEEAGGRRAAERFARRHLGEAVTALDVPTVRPAAAADLAALARWVCAVHG